MRILPSALLVSAAIAAPASAKTVVGGDLVLKFVTGFQPFGISVTADNPATSTVLSQNPTELDFKLTDGDFTSRTFGDFAAFASGFTFSDNGFSIDLRNPTVSLEGNAIYGDVTGSGITEIGQGELFTFNNTAVSLAKLRNTANPTDPLYLGSALAQLLVTSFGLPNLTGSQVGVFAANPLTSLPKGGAAAASFNLVPEPAALMLLGVSALGLGTLRRRAIAR